ncbi:endospore germination permease [Bacillaceae bacterium Marseille-Q3522]|nr:endospore germination permease [Bacillaceae bacterium Marseille-Q3522]
MLEKGKVSSGQFSVLVIVFTLGSSILVAPSLLAQIAGQDAWIVSLLTVFIGLSFIYLYQKLASLYPGLTFVEYNEKIFGKWVGKITSVLFLCYFFQLSAIELREIGDFLTTQVLVETPIQMIMLLFLIISLYAIQLGLEVMTRTVIIFFPWMAGMLILLVLLTIPEMKPVYIQPVLGEGILPILKGTYHDLGLPYLELVIFLMFIPYVSENEKWKGAFYRGTLIGGILLSIVVVLAIVTLGSDFTARNAYPSYIVGKKASFGTFLERIEVIVAIIWFFTVFFKLTICIYGFSLGLAQVLRLNSFRILLIPLIFLLPSFALILHPNIVHFHYFIMKAWTPYSITICFILPLLLFIVGKLRKNRSDAKDI